MILAIETSGNVAGIAISDGQTVPLEWTWAAKGNHSVTVNRLLAQALQTLNIGMNAISAVAVSQGPGSFNGVRVGISLAKGLALARSIPLVGIPSLDALAFGASSASISVTAVIPAGRSEMFVASYCGPPHDWSRTSDRRRLSTSEAVEEASASALIVGPGIEELRTLAPELPYVESTWNLPRPAFLAELGRRYFEVGGQDQVRDLEPLYLRLSAAEEKRAADRGG